MDKPTCLLRCGFSNPDVYPETCLWKRPESSCSPQGNSWKETHQKPLSSSLRIHKPPQFLRKMGGCHTQMLHGAGSYLPTKLGDFWGFYVGKYSSTMVRIWDRYLSVKKKWYPPVPGLYSDTSRPAGLVQQFPAIGWTFRTLSVAPTVLTLGRDQVANPGIDRNILENHWTIDKNR